MIVQGPFPFAYNTAGLETNGITLLTIPANTIIYDAWIEIQEAWDGTTPSGDVGYFPNAHQGFFNGAGTIVDMTAAWDEDYSGAGNLEPTAVASVLPAAAGNAALPGRVPQRVIAPLPFGVIVNTLGYRTGMATGASKGQATLYVVTATLA